MRKGRGKEIEEIRRGKPLFASREPIMMWKRLRRRSALAISKPRPVLPPVMRTISLVAGVAIVRACFFLVSVWIAGL